MPRIVAVRTAAEDGHAVFGTVDADAVAALRQRTLDWMEKAPGAQAAAHHPPETILLTIVGGSHTIFISGEPERSTSLNPGDQILFCDYQPASPPPAPAYAGHRSVAGPNGASFFRVLFDGLADVQSLDWRDE